MIYNTCVTDLYYTIHDPISHSCGRHPHSRADIDICPAGRGRPQSQHEPAPSHTAPDGRASRLAHGHGAVATRRRNINNKYAARDSEYIGGGPVHRPARRTGKSPATRRHAPARERRPPGALAWRGARRTRVLTRSALGVRRRRRGASLGLERLLRVAALVTGRVLVTRAHPAGRVPVGAEADHVL